MITSSNWADILLRHATGVESPIPVPDHAATGRFSNVRRLPPLAEVIIRQAQAEASSSGRVGT